MDVNQPVWLNGINIGQIITRELTPEGVLFSVAIEPRYRHLIHADSRFAAASRVDVQVGLDGVEVKGASAQEFLQGGINVIAGAKGTPKTRYTLYGDLKSARAGIDYADLKPTLTLQASELPDIQQGSGLSEEIIGRWLQQGGRRERIVLSTKVYQPMGPGPNDRRLSAYHIS